MRNTTRRRGRRRPSLPLDSAELLRSHLLVEATRPLWSAR